MIRMRDMTPSPYYDQSRDFQLIGSLFDLILNSVKTSADQIYNVQFNDNTDNQLLDLMAMTLGFKSRHNYNSNQLRALCSSFCEILRNKGSLYSVELAAKVLVHSEGLSQQVYSSVDNENHIIYVYLPQTLSDINLFNDILLYILPAGMSCTIVRTMMYVVDPAVDKFETEDSIRYKTRIDDNYDQMQVNVNNREDEQYNRARPLLESTDDDDTRHIVIRGLFGGGQIFQPERTAIWRNANGKTEKK